MHKSLPLHTEFHTLVVLKLHSLCTALCQFWLVTQITTMSQWHYIIHALIIEWQYRFLKGHMNNKLFSFCFYDFNPLDPDVSLPPHGPKYRLWAYLIGHSSRGTACRRGAWWTLVYGDKTVCLPFAMLFSLILNKHF